MGVEFAEVGVNVPLSIVIGQSAMLSRRLRCSSKPELTLSSKQAEWDDRFWEVAIGKVGPRTLT